MTDFVRARVCSLRHSHSVTAEIPVDSFETLGPEAAAQRASCDLFRCAYNGHDFHVVVTGDPKDMDLVLRTIARRLRNVYDDAHAAWLVGWNATPKAWW